MRLCELAGARWRVSPLLVALAAAAVAPQNACLGTLQNRSQSACRCNYGSREDPSIPIVDVAGLLADQERYRGRIVRVRGYINLEFEDMNLYERQAQQVAGSPNWRNGTLWIATDDRSLWREYSHPCEKDLVIVQGEFNPMGHGHFSMSGGELRNVTRVRWAGDHELRGRRRQDHPQNDAGS